MRYEHAAARYRRAIECKARQHPEQAAAELWPGGPGGRGDHQSALRWHGRGWRRVQLSKELQDTRDSGPVPGAHHAPSEIRRTGGHSAANLLFFEKGEPTKEVWYFEHPYPPGYKSYSKTKPIRIEEFDLEKEWWGNGESRGNPESRENREENEYAWKVPIATIRENGFNLDIKNPHTEEEELGDPVELLAAYKQMQEDLEVTRTALRDELKASLDPDDELGGAVE